MPKKQILGFSGGKDSTSLALRLHELGEDFDLVFTPTDDELPPLKAHLELVSRLVDKPIIIPPNRSLDFWINEYNALPNYRQRWCTRQIKILPCIAHMRGLQREENAAWRAEYPDHHAALDGRPTLLVGLRADEEHREGLWGEYAKNRFPLREWGWGLKEVQQYLRDRGVVIPPRTDCARCPYQRIGEWYQLWQEWPEYFQRGVDDEARTGHTYRSPGSEVVDGEKRALVREDGVRISGRDTWPQRLEDLRGDFERGRVPKLRVLRDEEGPQACRVCRM